MEAHRQVIDDAELQPGAEPLRIVFALSALLLGMLAMLPY